MKKIIPVISAIGAFLIVTGFLCKSLHWPLAGAGIVLGFLVLILFPLPNYGYNLVYELSGRKSKLLAVFGGITFFFIGLTTVGKFMHWPGSALFMLVEFIFPAIFVLPGLMFIKLKGAENSKQRAFIFSGHLSLSLLMLGLVFKIMHWPGASALTLLGVALLLLIYIPFALMLYNNDEGRKKLKRILLIIPLITLLAFYVFGVGASSGILNSFINIDNSIKESESSPSAKRLLYYSLMKQMNDSSVFYAKAMKVKSISDDLYNHIENLKAYLISQTDRKPFVSPSPKLSEVDSKDNVDIPTFILIGNDELNLAKGAYSAVELRNKIEVYRMDVLSMYSEGLMKEDANKTMGLKTDATTMIDGVGLSWEMTNFYHLPLVTVITYLSKLQLDVRTTELATVEYLYNMSMQAGVPLNERK
ncbi:MAG: hypothetical protein ACJ76F_10910 [Bacteroidia bacterium]